MDDSGVSLKISKSASCPKTAAAYASAAATGASTEDIR
jgi:hypothetical protein